MFKMFLQEFNIFYKINNRINNLFRKPATQKIIIKWPKLALLVQLRLKVYRKLLSEVCVQHQKSTWGYSADDSAV